MGYSMYNIAVIGAGQLGSRHLQGLATFRHQCNLHIVDPFDKSMAVARARIDEVGPNANIKGVFSHISAVTLPDVIDLAVVATTADVRMAAIAALFGATSVKSLVLEKVLFQRFGEYAAASELIKQKGIKCWVNCPRRMYPVYADLKNFFADDPITYMSVHGGDWGLGCNAVHFLDLLAFFYEKGNFTFDTSNLDTEARVSKRPGFVEYTGMLQGCYGGAKFSLTSICNSRAKHLITLRGERKSAVVDEVGGRLWAIDEAGSRVIDFSLPFQSQLTGLVAESILLQGDCGLTPYEQSAEMHLPLLKAFASHGVVGELPDLCALT